MGKRSRCCLHCLLSLEQASKFCAHKKKMSSVFGSELRNKISWAWEKKAVEITRGSTEPGSCKLTSACQAFAHSRKKRQLFFAKDFYRPWPGARLLNKQTKSRMFVFPLSTLQMLNGFLSSTVGSDVTILCLELQSPFLQSSRWPARTPMESPNGLITLEIVNMRSLGHTKQSAGVDIMHIEC